MSDGPTLVIDGIKWDVEETTLDSAVMTDFIHNRQTVAFRLICSRSIGEEAQP